MSRFCAVICVLVVLLDPTLLQAEGPKEVLTAEVLWEILYERRESVAIQSGQVAYLRRLYAIPRTTPEEQALQRAQTIEHMRRIQGEDYLAENVVELDRVLQRANATYCQTFFERYKFQDEAFLVESAEIAGSCDTSLAILASTPDTINSGQSSVYSYDGRSSVALIHVDGEATIVFTDEAYRMPPIKALGRAPDRMPRLTDLVRQQASGTLLMLGSDNGGFLCLTIGDENGHGMFMRIRVDATRDFSIAESEVRVDGRLIIHEMYSDFIWTDSGLWTPRMATRTNYAIIEGESVVVTREEFLMLESAVYNVVFEPTDLQIPYEPGIKEIDFRQRRLAKPKSASTK